MNYVTARIDSICETMIHNLEIMYASIEYKRKFTHKAIIETIVFKGTSLTATYVSMTVGWVFTGIYSAFKTYDAARLFRKTMYQYVPPDKNNKYALQEHNWYGLNWVWLKDFVYSKKMIGIFQSYSNFFRKQGFAIKHGGGIL